MRHLLITTALMLTIPASTLAQDMALVLGQERYEQLDRVRGADAVLQAERRLEALGFEVLSRANGRVDAVRDLATAFQAQAARADRLVVALSGHFVTDGTRNWMLTAEASAPNVFDVEAGALSLDSVLAVLAQKQGKAVLLLGVADPEDLQLEGGVLRSGLSDLDVPQGVAVVRTSPSTAGRILSGVLTDPNAVIGAPLLAMSGVEVDGYLPRDMVLMPDEVIVEPAVAQDGPTDAELNAEAALWDRTTALDTVEAYRIYVARYPTGRFVEEAETQITAILQEPNRAARLAEDALKLTRAQRRDIQSDLTLLEYNTRGVDGILGRGSRGAIMNWQQSNGFPQTSYLDRDQINLLDAQAARRQAEIDAQEARERAAAEARDRTYWTETGGRGDEPGFRAYIDRYPEGLFANIARARLAEIEDARRAQAEAADRAAWTSAEREDTLTAYRAYVAAYPDGVFVQEARDRIEDLSAPQVSEAQLQQDRTEEARLRLSGVRAQLLELRLRELGLDPGRLDGVIDTQTRAAITAYQEREDIPATGFVGRSTAVGLISGSINITIGD